MGVGEENNGSEPVGTKRKVDGVEVDTVELAKLRAQAYVARLVNDAETKRPRLQDSTISSPAVLTTPSADTQKVADRPKENSQSGLTSQEAYPVSTYGYQATATSKKMDIPNAKVGVIIGKGGETIKNLQLQSGAKIQVAKDTEVDPSSLTRTVELVGTAEQISRAEELITDVIAKTDAGVSGSFAAGGLNSVQPGAEQFVMKIPNHKVARVIGKGGETIKSMQSRSGARIQVIPLHLPPGDTSTERNVHINGTQEQIELAKGLVNEVISEQSYSGSGRWVPPTQPSMCQPGYGYTQTGAYPTPPPAYYGSYPSQPVGWDQSNLPAVPPQQNTGANYYGQQDQTGSAGSTTNLSYGQTQLSGANYEQGYSHQSQIYGQNIPSQVTQETHATSGYGPPNVSSQPEGTTPSVSYVAPASSQPPPYYGQSPAMAPTSAYAPPSYPNPLPPPSYDQTAYTQSGYGVQPPAEVPVQSQPPMSQAVYGQGGYPPQPSPYQSGYYQNTGVYGQTFPQVQGQLQPPTPQPVYGQAGYPPQQSPQTNYYQGTNAYGQTQLPQAQPQSQSQPQPQVYTTPAAYGAETNGNNSVTTPGNATGSAVQDVVNPQS